MVSLVFASVEVTLYICQYGNLNHWEKNFIDCIVLLNSFGRS